MDLGPDGAPRWDVRSVPKVELHVHLDGAFDSALLFEASRDPSFALPDEVTSAWDGKPIPVRAPILSCTSETDFHELVSCHGQRSLCECIKRFEFFLPLVRGRLDLIERLAQKFVENQAAQNVIYTEVRYAPQLLAAGSSMGTAGDASLGEAEAVIDAVTRGLRAGESATGITVNQILCGIAWRPEWADQTVTLAAARMHDFPCAIVGYDIAAGEIHFDSPDLHEPHRLAALRARELGLGVTVHAGEEGAASNVLRAIEEYGAVRVGHGYSLSQDPKLLAEIVCRGVHFECCPTSSFETGGWNGSSAESEDWVSHPIKTLLDAGASVSINTDDPSVFSTSLAGEYGIIRERMGVTDSQLTASVIAAIDAAFVSEDERQRLRKLASQHSSL